MIHKKISEAERLPPTIEGLDVYEKGAYYGCFVSAIGEEVAFHWNELHKSYLGLPVSIKTDMLTLTIYNKAVQAKITNWIKEVYLTK